MNHRTRMQFIFLATALLLFYSCEKDDFISDELENPDSHLILEARDYFEEYASIEMEGEPTGLHPGNIAPEWDKAKVFNRPGSLAINIPLITEATYEGSFYSDNDTTDFGVRDTYSTTMLQKLIVVKDLETELYGCYIATIIPAERHATKNSTKIEKMFYGGDPYSEFNGTVVYSTVTTNYTISVEKYINGALYEEKSMFYASINYYKDLHEMSQALSSARIKRNVRAMTKNGEYGGDGTIWLPEVVITPPPTPTPTPPPSLPGPPDPPSSSTNPPGSSDGYPYGYPPGYIPPTPPPTTGSGNSGGSNNGSQQYPVPQLSSPGLGYDETTEKVNLVLPQIYEMLKEMGIDLSEFKLEIAIGCASSAQKYPGYSIGICIKFVNGGYTLNDQTSIIWHEIFHAKNDDPKTDMGYKPVTPPVSYSNIPPDIENYIRAKSIDNNDYNYLITRENIQSPQYYRNEIAAYQAEIKNGISVSSSYAKERAYLLWEHQQNLQIAEEHFYKSK